MKNGTIIILQGSIFSEHKIMPSHFPKHHSFNNVILHNNIFTYAKHRVKIAHARCIIIVCNKYFF